MAVTKMSDIGLCLPRVLIPLCFLMTQGAPWPEPHSLLHLALVTFILTVWNHAGDILGACW